MSADWNAVATVHSEGYRDARKILAAYGRVRPTAFFNVLAITAEDPLALLDQLDQLAAAQPGIMNFISRVVPAKAAFDFSSREAFERQAREVVLAWAPDLRGKSFYVRMHRRGLREILESRGEERFIADVLLDATREMGEPARISFEDPDVVLSIETVGDRAGLSFWTREDLRRYPFLRPD